jgi:hypothetical protein
MRITHKKIPKSGVQRDIFGRTDARILESVIPISIYLGSEAYVVFATIPLFYEHIRLIPMSERWSRMTNRAAMPKG